MNNNNQSHYPRSEVRSELATRQTTINNTLQEMKYNGVLSNNEIKAIELKAKNYNYTAIYGYIMDLICAFVTDYRDTKGAITEGNNNYYLINLRRETVEKYAFGDYTKVRSQFWKAFYKVVSEPKTLYMITPDGEYLGEPIHITAKLADGTLLKAKNFENLQNATKMIETVQIEFFKPMFKEVVENHQNWIPLPRYLQAIIETELIENPTIAQWRPQSRYHTYDTETLTAQQIRLYFLYMTDHNNNTGDFMNVKALEFWQCVHPANVKKQKVYVEGSDKPQDNLYLTDWNKARYEFNAFTRFHSHLAKQGKIDGINFTTCNAWYEPKDRVYRVAVYRQKPLVNAPAFIEYDEQKQIAEPANNGAPDLQSEYNSYIWEHDNYITFEEYINMRKATAAWNEGANQVMNNNNDDYNPFEYNPFEGYGDQNDTPQADDNNNIFGDIPF
jgi:hypothetical protein